MNGSPVQKVLGACPSREELKAFDEGELSQPALERIAKHIEAHCPQWRLAGTTRGPGTERASADFFVYERAHDQ